MKMFYFFKLKIYRLLVVQLEKKEELAKEAEKAKKLAIIRSKKLEEQEAAGWVTNQFLSLLFQA